MADDIQINSGAGANGAQGSGQSGANSTGNSGQNANGAAQNAQNTASAGQQAGGVIDLRAVDQAQPAAPTPTQPTGGSAPRSSGAALFADVEEEANAAPEKYSIPPMVKEKFPDLVQMIKETESMNDEERDYWFQILPIMTEDQIKKLRDILINEKEQLTRLDDEYEKELSKLNEKHLVEWKEFEAKEKRKALTSAETASKSQEEKEQEDLLMRLSQV